MNEKFKNYILISCIVIISALSAVLFNKLQDERNNRKKFDIQVGNQHIEGWYEENK